MALGEFFYGAMDPSSSTMDQTRKLRPHFLYRAIKFFQAFLIGQIGTTQHNGQPLLRSDRLQVFRSFLVSKIVCDYLSTGPCEAQRNGLADAARASGNQNRFARQRKQINPARAHSDSAPLLRETVSGRSSTSQINWLHVQFLETRRRWKRTAGQQ